jgi:hypothetical protein
MEDKYLQLTIRTLSSELIYKPVDQNAQTIIVLMVLYACGTLSLIVRLLAQCGQV